jgi:undecaprenyl-diphosphatase
MPGIDALDQQLLTWLRGFHTPSLDLALSIITISGIMGGIWQLFALIGMTRARWRAAAWRTFLTVWLALVITNGVAKPLFDRTRPLVPPEPTRTLAPASDTASFPSGHAASAVAGAMAVSRMWPAGRLAWWTLAILMAYSRIYLGHHYPLDIIGGSILGGAIALWVLGGRHPATYAGTLPASLPAGVIVKP